MASWTFRPVSLRSSAAIQLGLTYVERTKEFEEQELPQRFGAVSISMKY